MVKANNGEAYWKNLPDEQLLETIKERSPLSKVGSVFEITARNLCTEDFINALICLINDVNSSYIILDFFPFTMSQVAQAALLHLGFSGYSDENNEGVKWLLEEFKNEVSTEE